MIKNKEEYEKAIMQQSALLEQHFGMKILHTFQCIHCGKIMDDIDIASDHIFECDKKPKMI